MQVEPVAEGDLTGSDEAALGVDGVADQERAVVHEQLVHVEGGTRGRHRALDEDAAEGVDQEPTEGERDAQINQADGEKQRVIKESEAARQQQINEAEGQAQAILAVATATAEGLRRVAEALQNDGGSEAMQLRIAEQYIAQFGELAKEGNTFVVPSNLSDVSSMIALATGMLKDNGAGPPEPVRRP